MKNISIKIFNILFVAILLLGESILFAHFYNYSKETIKKLLTVNIQTDILNIKHYVDKNINKKGVASIVSHLDNIVLSNELFDNIAIFDNKERIIYSSLRNNKFKKENCIKILNITEDNVLEHSCYVFSIKVYKRLDVLYYRGYVHLNKKYIDDMLHVQFQKVLIYYLISSVLFILLYWIVQNKIVIRPLECLRQYAYYNKNKPKNFFIKELESIRYSLQMTFERLKKEQIELYKLSTIDPLSGLYNRLSLLDKLKWLTSKNNRDDTKFAIIFLDLDNFKDINDSMGHNFGDKILQEISKVLLYAVRENDIVSRIGGDEFVIVLPEIEDELSVAEVAKRIKTELSNSAIVENFRYAITASMGITIYPKDGKDVDTLLKNADIAMYKSKELGKNNYYFFSNELNKKVQEKIDIQKIMRNALEHGYFKLYYQPKVEIKSGKIVGCEALIRLIDPIQGIISPDKFIPLAEESHFIIPLGRWIIKEAISQVKKWENTPLKDIKVSINISAKQFKDESFVDELSKYIKEIDSSKIDLELTESVFISGFEENFKIIHNIKRLGITLSLDDFGTGYSSLSYLKRIPFDAIKIDKSFIDDLACEGENKLFVNMIVDIAKSLNLEVIAEGVEEIKQLEYLKEIGCDLYQGYLYSKPITAEEFEKLYLKN